MIEVVAIVVVLVFGAVTWRVTHRSLRKDRERRAKDIAELNRLMSEVEREARSK